MTDSPFARLIPFLMRRQRELYLDPKIPIDQVAASLDLHVSRQIAGQVCASECLGCRIDRDAEAFIALEKMGIHIDETVDDEDPTPWCSWCGAKTPDKCKCPPRAEND